MGFTNLDITKYYSNEMLYANGFHLNVTGNIGAFINNIKIRSFQLSWNNRLYGSIETCCANMTRLRDIGYRANINYSGHGVITSPVEQTIYGDIAVFGDKYDLIGGDVGYRLNVTGKVRSLKNLKKLRYWYAPGCSITGSKSDLYNSGANVTWFAISHTWD